MAMAELAWMSFGSPMKIYQKRVVGADDVRLHPTQKPVSLYKWILDNYAKTKEKILDTHLGSGSIAIACHDYGFELTACELDKEYYEKSIDRIKTHIAFNQSLFTPEELKETNTLF
jgi:site-specific DNA-methyltransferase (adenine-specific)